MYAIRSYYAFESNSTYWETEILSEQDQYNDYVITSLRTQWGIKDIYLKETFSRKFYTHFQSEIEPFIRSGHVRKENGAFLLNTEGLFISDKIMDVITSYSIHYTKLYERFIGFSTI